MVLDTNSCYSTSSKVQIVTWHIYLTSLFKSYSPNGKVTGYGQGAKMHTVCPIIPRISPNQTHIMSSMREMI